MTCSKRARLRSLLPLLPLWVGLGGAVACGPTEVLVGDAPGVSRVVAGVLGVQFQVAFPDTAPGGLAVDVALGVPSGLAASDDGAFYFADAKRRRIGRVEPDGSVSWPVGKGACGFPGLTGTGGTDVCLGEPGPLALAADGTLFLADVGAPRVYRYDPAADRVTVVLGTGSSGAAPDGATANTAPTDSPEALAIGPDGFLYVAERRNHRVVRVDAGGTVSVVAGSATVIGDAGDGGPARDATLRGPSGLAWMGDTLYLADGGNHRVRRVVGGQISAYAGLGAAGFAGDRGPVTTALFDTPGRMAVAGTLLFVADRGNNRVRVMRVGPDSIDTYAGTGVGEPGDDRQAIGRTAIAGPLGVAAGGRALFVSDSGGFVVRRVIR